MAGPAAERLELRGVALSPKPAMTLARLTEDDCCYLPPGDALEAPCLTLYRATRRLEAAGAVSVAALSRVARAARQALGGGACLAGVYARRLLLGEEHDDGQRASWHALPEEARGAAPLALAASFAAPPLPPRS